MLVAIDHIDLAKDMMRDMGAELAVPALLKQMRQRYAIVDSAGALGSIGKPAADALVVELQKPDQTNRFAAIYAFSADDRLARCGTPALPAIEAGYSGDADDLQEIDVKAMIRIGRATGTVDKSFLLDITSDDNPMACELARRFMGISGPLITNSQSTLAVIEAMDIREEDREFVRLLRGSRELFFHTVQDHDRYLSLRNRYKPDVDQLIALLGNRNGSLRLAAARKLQRYNFLAMDAAIPLSRLATDQKRSPVSESTDLWLALREVGPAGVRVLLAHLTDSNPDERLLIAQTLEAYGQGASEAVPLLITRLDANEPDTIDATLIRVLGSIGPYASPALPALNRIADGSDPARAAQAREAIRKIRNDPFRLAADGTPLPPVAAETPGSKNP